MAGPLTPLRLARVQDATAWATLAVALVLAPWAEPWRRLGLPQPDPPGAAVAAGAVLAVAAVALLRSRGPRPVVAALIADAAGAVAVATWTVAAGPATGTPGTVVLAVVAAGLALQAAFDGLMLLQARAGPPVERGSDRP